MVVGGDYRTGTVSDWFICLDHADSINETRECYTVPTIPVTIIDVYLINWINHQARDYYFNRWATDD